MDRDLVQNMTGDELRFAIATILGMHPFRKGKYLFYKAINEGSPRDNIPTETWDCLLPYWDRDVNAAFALLDKFPDVYFSLCRTNDTYWRPAPWGKIHWECRLYAPEKGAITADIAAMAISKAWLVQQPERINQDDNPQGEREINEN